MATVIERTPDLATPRPCPPAQTLRGHILTPRGFVLGTLAMAEGRIMAVDGEPRTEFAVRQSRLPLVLPGCIDLHVHGGGGRDTMEGGDAMTRIASLHARHGTPSLLATTMTAPPAELHSALAALGAMYSNVNGLDTLRASTEHFAEWQYFELNAKHHDDDQRDHIVGDSVDNRGEDREDVIEPPLRQ